MENKETRQETNIFANKNTNTTPNQRIDLAEVKARMQKLLDRVHSSRAQYVYK